MRCAIMVISALALAACSAERPAIPLSQAATSPPDLAVCQSIPVEPLDPDEFGPPEATPVPEAFNHVVATDVSYIAVTTLSGGTVCADNSWTGEIVQMKWLAGERFLGWQWWGYEAFGYKLADRSGNGSIMDTGARPHFSPSGNRIASLQVSDAGWGGLEGFAVWQLSSDGFDPLSVQVAAGDGPHPQVFLDNSGQWSFVGWRGEDCMQMALNPYGASPVDPRGTSRRIYFAHEDNGWQIIEGRCS